MKGNLLKTLKVLSVWFSAVLVSCVVSGSAPKLFAQGAFEQELMNLARQSERFGKLEEAEKLCRRILISDPMNQYAHHRLGVMAAARGDLDQGIAHFSAAERGGPPSPQLLNDFGGALYMKGNLTTAEQKLRAALTLNPENQDATRNLELVLVKQQATAAAAAEERAAAESQAAQHRQAAVKAIAAAKAAVRARDIAEARAVVESRAASQAIAEAKMAGRLHAIAEAKKLADNRVVRPVDPSQLAHDQTPSDYRTPTLPPASTNSIRIADISPNSTHYRSLILPILPESYPAATPLPAANECDNREGWEDSEDGRSWAHVFTRFQRLFKHD
jgi:Tfp pilus assembly protein PilF